MWNYTRTYFSQQKARKFDAIVDGTIWNGTDAFGQTIYTVMWN